MRNESVNRPESALLGEIAANLVAVSAGVIRLKDEGTSRWWTEQIRPFRIGRFAVTREEYWVLSGKDSPDAEGRNKPVVEVSWLEAVEFCNLLSRKAGLAECYAWDSGGEAVWDRAAGGYRLPSEAEWEFACRAGSNQPRYGELDEIAWHKANSGGRLREVGTRQPNAWGLYDTLGNVWEWCWDVFDAEVYGPYRVFRGGGWSDPPNACRASSRRKSHPTFRIDDLGFRLARSGAE